MAATAASTASRLSGDSAWASALGEGVTRNWKQREVEANVARKQKTVEQGVLLFPLCLNNRLVGRVFNWLAYFLVFLLDQTAL